MRTSLLILLAAGALTHATAGADELPARKPGLWQITRSAAQPKLPPQVQRICLDAATDALLYRYGLTGSQKLCSKVEIHRSAERIEIQSTCAIGSSHASTRTAITLHGDQAYHQDIAVHFDPPVGRTSDSVSSQDAKWLGACPAEMKPGDIVTEPSALMPAPLRMNIRNLIKNPQ